ncbi:MULTISPECIES: DUF3077 domain-containing protein [Pseudomonas]|uniref:DUF3077 domain-containing protein n=1 Tax=Pseudomonas fulva TaxID=47880 RepID=A0A0D0JD72_9PSED|nr:MULTISPECIES: DUF3077 domain-containing protein [Pseudomonas]KIQ03917.1 hypothetical protein RU08_06050 [Pseudomonas fulva]
MTRRAIFATRVEGLFEVAGKPLVSVNAGMPVEEALSRASCILGTVVDLAMNVGDDGIRGTEVFAIQYLVEMAKALVDASSVGEVVTEAPNA